MKRRIACFATVAMLATACGSTVQTTGLADTGPGGVVGDPGSSSGLGSELGAADGSGPGSAAGGTDGAAGFSGTGGTASVAGAGGSSSTGGVSSPGSGGGPSSVTAGPGGAPLTGSTGPVRGVTDDTITVGTIDSASEDQALADAGITGGRQGSNERKAVALIEKINGDGGIAGRTMKLEVFKTDASSSPEAICTFFTQDREVFAVLDYGQFSGEELRACLTKRNVVLLGDHGTRFDSKDLQANPALWPVNGFNVERKIRAQVEGLAAQGYFGPWDPRTAAAAPAGDAKVGLIYYETEFNERQNPVLRAAMAKQGMTFFREFGIRLDNAGQQADTKAAVLRFAADGVSHVIFNQEINGGMFGNFGLQASSQGYYPRYGVSSYDFPQLVKANLPDHKVFNGMKGIGWLPYTDVDTPQPLGAVQNSCLKIFQDKGQTPADINERTIMLINCDVYFKFAKVATVAGRNLSPQSFFAAIGSLGAAEPCHACDRVDYTRHIDGIAAVSYLEYGSDCDCIRYTKTGIPAA